MDSEFPDPDEEYDLLHEDEYEVLKEIEGTAAQKLPKQIENVKKVENGIYQKNESNSVAHDTSESQRYNKICKEINGTGLGGPSTSKNKDYNDVYATDTTKKRSYDEIFGDISDILDIDNFDIQEPRDKRPRWDQPKEIIQIVLDARERFNETHTGVSVKKKYEDNRKRESISERVPQWNFVAVTRSYDSQRIYVRLKNEIQKIENKVGTTADLLSVPYSQLKSEAEDIIVKNVERSCREPINQNIITEDTKDYELWVDKYRPKSYIELLSDESVNRHFLHWIKLWDKIVFNRNFAHQKKKKETTLLFGAKKINNENVEEEVDSKGFPIHRIALLTGPPGLGKTTLAHLAAKHAGYNVVEINASDERSPDAFRQVLLASTQMKAVMGNDPRPNCLILDEIDGAPVASIELLLKFVQGKLTTKHSKDKSKSEKTTVCHRPVICICNEPYTPSLRTLRAAALIIPVPEVTPARLADRLLEIARKEEIKVNTNVLLKLAEISGCDVRSCLGTLQYLGSATLGDKLSFALKDSRKGLFDCWKQILTIPMSRAGLLSIPDRTKLILKTVQNGEADKLAQGIFHNYPEVCGEKFRELTTPLTWFQFFDEIMNTVMSHQNWSVMPYTNYAFVNWHLYFAKARSPKLSYPTVIYEVTQKIAKSVGILTAVQRSSGRDSITLATDLAPFLPDLLSPRLRTVSGHLHSSKERDDIARLVNILLEYGLTFSQERNLDGTYEYKLDPNIFEIGVFPECKVRHPLAYAAKQIIAQELNAERLRRAASITGITKEPEKKIINNSANKADSNPENVKEVSKTATNLITSSNKSEDPHERLSKIKYKDFFGRPITMNQNQNEQNSKWKSDNAFDSVRNLLTKHGVWYKYKEGFSNAVRKKVLIDDLL